jgi:hypothetical protein
VLLEKRAVGRVAIDVPLLDGDALLLQITSGVAAGRSRRLPEKGRLGHAPFYLPDRLAIDDFRLPIYRLTIVDRDVRLSIWIVDCRGTCRLPSGRSIADLDGRLRRSALSMDNRQSQPPTGTQQISNRQSPIGSLSLLVS